MEIGFLLILKDRDGKPHRQKPVTFSDETTIKELSKAINSFWNIHRDYQQLFYNGKQIISLKSTLKETGVKDNNEIVIKHLHLDQWKAYVNRVEQFENAQINETRKDSTENAQRFYDLLLGSSFFTVYPNFDIAVTKLHKPIIKYLDKLTRWIQNAAKNFFALSMLKGQNPAIEFEETNDGTPIRWNLDLIELYCYKILESIGLGPKVVFIPNIVASKSILYIGSEWLEHFRSFNSTEQVNTTEVTRTVVQIHFLAVFLSLGDMHEENFGMNANSDPIILDFMITNYGDPQHKFLHENNVIRSIRARDILENCDSTVRLQIAKDAVRNWNLMEKLSEVLELMNKEKENFGRDKLDFDKKTQDLEEYVERVRSNIQDLYHSTL